MSTHQQIRFSVKETAIDEVQKLIENYSRYVADYAESHDEKWTWSTYQRKDSPTDFVSVISHEDAEAEKRHMATGETKAFAKDLYAHVTDDEQIALEQVASSEG